MNAGIILKQFCDAVQQRNMALARSYLDENMTFMGLLFAARSVLTIVRDLR